MSSWSLDLNKTNKSQTRLCHFAEQTIVFDFPKPSYEFKGKMPNNLAAVIPSVRKILPSSGRGNLNTPPKFHHNRSNGLCAVCGRTYTQTDVTSLAYYNVDTQ